MCCNIEHKNTTMRQPIYSAVPSTRFLCTSGVSLEDLKTFDKSEITSKAVEKAVGVSADIWFRDHPNRLLDGHYPKYLLSARPIPLNSAQKRDQDRVALKARVLTYRNSNAAGRQLHANLLIIAHSNTVVRQKAAKATLVKDRKDLTDMLDRCRKAHVPEYRIHQCNGDVSRLLSVLIDHETRRNLNLRRTRLIKEICHYESACLIDFRIMDKLRESCKTLTAKQDEYAENYFGSIPTDLRKFIVFDETCNLKFRPTGDLVIRQFRPFQDVRTYISDV